MWLRSIIVNSKKIIIANWKMNGNTRTVENLVKPLVEKMVGVIHKVVIIPPFTILNIVHDIIKLTDVSLGAQDCSHHHGVKGAYTGEISATMLKDIGCEYLLVGHSERRKYHNETNEIVKTKARLAHEEGLTAIICVGETEGERREGKEFDSIRLQLEGSIPSTATSENTIIAYEPLWAIGSGKVATSKEITEMHKYISEFVQNEDFKKNIVIFENPLRIVYGGSVKAANADELLQIDKVDGLLVGGASLILEEFESIIR
jgi:triosephosphate isomerase